MHTRRQFFEAKGDEPVLADEMMEHIATLFAFEQECKTQGLEGEEKHNYPLTNNKSVVDGIIERVQSLLQERAFLPSAPFT